MLTIAAMERKQAIQLFAISAFVGLLAARHGGAIIVAYFR